MSFLRSRLRSPCPCSNCKNVMTQLPKTKQRHLQADSDKAEDRRREINRRKDIANGASESGSRLPVPPSDLSATSYGAAAPMHGAFDFETDGEGAVEGSRRPGRATPGIGADNIPDIELEPDALRLANGDEFFPAYPNNSQPSKTSFVIDEDDVQFLYETEILKCQLCLTSLQKLSVEQRQAHYERHFSGNQEPQASGSGPVHFPNVNMSTSNLKHKSQPSRLKEKEPPAKQNIFWFQAQSTPPPDNFTPGLIPTLRRALLKTHAKGVTTRAMLCHEGATHVATEFWDRGWGCGYRNFLMACTALINQPIQPLYFPLLDDPLPPGVRNLQYWIEDAWADGFDREGAEQLHHKLVGTKKWIGAAELYVAFISRGIPAQLVDFPGSERGPEAVTEWIMNYFSPPIPNKQSTNAFNALKGASPVISTDRMPLVLQHAGHSRTVVGFEVNKKGDPNLLIFDPSIRPGKELRRAALTMYSPSLPSPSPLKDKGRKRRVSNDNADGRELKRVRRGPEDPSNDIIVIDDDEDEEAFQDTLDSTKVVNFFRVNQSKLGKNNRYQILYFPLHPPLEDNERWARRVVISEKVV